MNPYKWIYCREFGWQLYDPNKHGGVSKGTLTKLHDGTYHVQGTGAIPESTVAELVGLPEADYLKVYHEFWKSIVENPDGTLNRDQVARELCDFHDMMDEVTKVYMEVAGLSKPNTKAAHILSALDEKYLHKGITQDDIKDKIAAYREWRDNEGDTSELLNNLLAELEEYFEIETEE